MGRMPALITEDMKQKKDATGSLSSLQPFVLPGIHQESGHYAVNIAYSDECDGLLYPTRNVYRTQSVAEANKESNREQGRLQSFKWLTLSVCLIATAVILMYLWFHVQYTTPSYIEVFTISPPPKLSILKTSITQVNPPMKSIWRVDYDIPDGIPLKVMDAKDMVGMSEDCPPQKFALAVYVDSNSELAENWMEACGSNVAYFRADGNPSAEDVERLVRHVPDAEYLPRKAVLHVERGENMLNHPEFQKAQQSDEIIRSVEMSGFITPKTVVELADVVPYLEELTISGAEVCSSLQRHIRSQQDCRISWPDLVKLRVDDAQECKGLYDLIYSCWNMPQIQTLQIRQSMITKPNANFIRSIIDRYRITKVYFADNVCFDDTQETYPFMCQSS